MDAQPHYRSFYELALEKKSDDAVSAMSDSSVDEADHARVVRETWAELQDKLPEVGRMVYEKVVSKNIDLATLFQDTTFASQHHAFTTMLGQSIKWLDDLRKWNRKMMPLAQRHVKYGVKPQHYKHFRSAFLKAIRQFLDPWNEEREDAWIWYWGKIMDTLGYATQSNLQNSSVGPIEHASNVRAIHESWRIVSEEPAVFGGNFYDYLIDSQPEMRDLFGSSDLNRQSIRFFTMFNHVVRQMDDEAGFENAIIGITFKHKLYGVEMHHVDAFGFALKQTMRTTLGERWTDEMSNAWDWLWGRIHACFEYGLEHSHEHEPGDTTMTERDGTDSDGSSTGVDPDISHARIFRPIISLQGRR